MAVPAAVLTSTFAAPVHAAEPGVDPRPGDRESSSYGQERAAERGEDRGVAPGSGPTDPEVAPDAPAAAEAETPAATPGVGADDAQADEAQADEAETDEAQADEAQAEQRRVVVCKYVRKPGETEIPHHVIVVDYHALEGRGFAGSFPYPFSDGQVGSVAVRYAEDGEQASEISLADCPATSEVPSGEEPAEAGTPGEDGEVLAISAHAAGTPASAARDKDEDGGVLPATGSPAYLTMLALLGALSTAAGAALLVARRRRALG